MNNSIVLSFLLILFLSGSTIFLLGFFPTSYQNIGIQNNETEYPTFLYDIKIDRPPKKYKQTTIMIIDAFRLDFVTSDMHSRACSNLNIEVSIPTVTMPRLKSLMTGTVSNYIDIVLNLGNTEELSDSIVHRLKSRGDIIAFAGDHTWINLFPTQFDRKYPNVDSFFVDDFYEGDNNITSILGKELFESDWTLLILHYLGLDHIGHVEGTESKKIPMKLKEMDDVVKKIYESNVLYPNHFAILNKLHDSLLLVTADHGMRNGGSHGGSTFEELHVPLLLYKESCRNKSFKGTEYKQIDLAPTLAILWALPIPKTSIGCLIIELLEDFSFEEQLNALYYNSEHLINKAILTFSKDIAEKSMYFNWHTNGKQLHKQFLMQKNIEGKPSNVLFERTKMEYIRASRTISNLLSEKSANFESDLLTIGISMTTLTTIFGFMHFTNVNKEDFLRYKLILIAFIAAIPITLWGQYMNYFIRSSQFYNYLLSIPIATSIYILFKILNALSSFRWKRISLQTIPLLFGFVVQTLSLASSSFIEYEQQSWYYMGITILIVMCLKMFRRKCCFKEIRTGNEIIQTIGSSVVSMGLSILIIVIIAVFKKQADTSHSQINNGTLQLSFWTGAGLITLILQLRDLIVPSQQFTIVATALSIYCYRSSNGSLVFPYIKHLNFIPFLYSFSIGIGLLMIMQLRNANKYRSLRRPNWVLTSGLCASLLIAALLHKPHNIPLIPLLFSALRMVYEMCDTLLNERNVVVFYKAAITIFVGNMFYYLQGNSNSLATIDVSPGYIGQSTYNPLVVAILVTLNTYSAPINAFLHLLVHISSSNNGKEKKDWKVFYYNRNGNYANAESIEVVMSIYTMATITPVGVYFCLLILFRYHLFIYSVFAPKALYAFYSVCVFFLKFSLTSLFLYLVK